ncbi:MAG: hypothetical protein JNM28_12385 [Armatimonadetes bacterium]|nr:hypothetical protein [Armatimonadota bacterium]
MLRAKRWSAYGLALLALPVVGKAQIPLLDTPSKEGSSASAPVGGKSSFDIVRLKEGALSVPLRFGNVIEKSETVVLAGHSLSRERDYTVDYASGVVYLKVPYRPGQSVTVSYRYDDSKQNEGVYGAVAANGANSFAFELTPGARAVLGFGYTERMADGTVLSGNLFGLASSFKFGGGNLRGVMMLNDRQKSDTASLLGDEGPKTDTETGTGKAIVQNYATNVLGGNVKLSYQDIDDRFAGFSSFAGAGFSPDEIKQFQGEKGLKRTGFSLTGAKVGGMGFGGGVQSVGDSNGSINWRSASATLAGVSLNWDSTVVDPSFNKFSGLREQDRQQLQKERGLERQNLGLGYKGGGAAVDFHMLSVQGTEDKQGVWRSNLSITDGWLKGTWSRQSVDAGFTRFGDLREADKGQLAKERGIDRNNYTLGVANKWLKADYSVDSMIADKGEMKGTSFNLGYGGWSLSHITRKMDEVFGAQGAMTNEDRQAIAGDVAHMYNPAGKPDGRDIGGTNVAGINRDGMRIQGKIGDFQSYWNRVTIDNQSGTLRLNEFSVSRGKTNLNFSHQTTTDGFGGNRNLLFSEQQRLGTIDGLNKSNLDFTTQFGKNSKLGFSQMSADSPNGGAYRQRLDAVLFGFDVTYFRRGVDSGFTDVNQLVDSERGLLQSLIGFDQSELIASYAPNSSLKFGYQRADAVNGILDQVRGFSQFSASWDLSKFTTLSYQNTNESLSESGLDSVDSHYSAYSFSHNMGSAGRVTVTQEAQSYNGVKQDLPDASKRTVSYEKPINANTTFSTVQSETKFDDGTRTTESRNKVTTKINSRIGVSVEDQRVRYDGDKPDDVRRNYGLWVDFGSGIRLDYGYNRDAHGINDGTMKTSVGLSGGKFAGLNFGGASYQTNRWDGQRQNYFGNVNFANLSPFSIGPVGDINFYYRTDTQRDFLAWQKELINMGISGAVGNIGFGWTYSSQVNQGDGVRAIDRSFLLTTDKTGKAPFQASLKYGVRTMPNNDTLFLRDYALTYRPNKLFSFEHKTLTNPLQDRGGVLLGSAPLDERTSSWTVKYQNDPKLKFDLNWNEIKRDNVNDELRREARANATLFADSGAPLQLTYSLQQWIRRGNVSLAHSYGLSFTQKPGPNQSLSFSLEHLQWGRGRPDNSYLRDWKLRFDYSVRF